MKILQIGKFYPLSGGVEKVMYELTVGLTARGIHCDMLCASAIGKRQVVKLNEYGSIICSSSLAKLRGTMISPAMIRDLRKIANNYDIIHIHHPDPMATLALKLSGYKGKIVFHWHSDILRQRLLLQAYRPLQKWILKKADVIVTTSQNYLDGSSWLDGFRDKATVLPIGINQVNRIDADINAIKKRYEGKKIIFTLGRLVPYKGYTYLVDAAGLLPDNYKIVIGGSGPLMNDLKAQAERVAPGKVDFLGRVSDSDKDALFYAADAFCLPSIMKTEAFGIVLIEAMSTGLPLIATNIPGSGTGWVNAHGESGLNAEPCDPQGLAEAILGVTSDSNQALRFRAGSKSRWENLFTSDAMIDGAISIYENALGNKTND